MARSWRGFNRSGWPGEGGWSESVAGLLRPPQEPAATPVLSAEQLYLRPPRASDWDAWSSLRAASRDFLVPWEPEWAPDALTRGAYLRLLRRYARDMRDGTGFAFLAFRRDDDQLLGGVSLSNVQRGVAQSGSLGYWVGEPFARRGHTTEAVRRLLPFVFETLGLHRLEAACLPANLASRGVLGGLGFTHEGLARRYLRINGEWEDHLLFALLDEDWRRQRRG